jgi:hypothetical protein
MVLGHWWCAPQRAGTDVVAYGRANAPWDCGAACGALTRSVGFAGLAGAGAAGGSLWRRAGGASAFARRHIPSAASRDRARNLLLRTSCDRIDATHWRASVLASNLAPPRRLLMHRRTNDQRPAGQTGEAATARAWDVACPLAKTAAPAVWLALLVPLQPTDVLLDNWSPPAITSRQQLVLRWVLQPVI